MTIALLRSPGWPSARSAKAGARRSRGRRARAIDAARAAEGLTPWAASPRLQHALVLEGSGDLAGAARNVAAAIERDSADWRLRLVQARIAAAAGDDATARAAMAAARALNPRSRLLAPAGTP